MYMSLRTDAVSNKHETRPSSAEPRFLPSFCTCSLEAGSACLTPTMTRPRVQSSASPTAAWAATRLGGLAPAVGFVSHLACLPLFYSRTCDRRRSFHDLHEIRPQRATHRATAAPISCCFPVEEDSESAYSTWSSTCACSRAKGENQDRSRDNGSTSG